MTVPAGTIVAIPTFDEAATIERALLAVRHSAPQADVVVVDDNSPDGTARLAEAVGHRIGGIHVLHRPVKGGLGPAYAAGFRWALEQGADYVVQLDADLSHDPAAIPALVSQCRAGADLAVGSRYVPGGTTSRWPWYRRALSRGGNWYAAALLRLPVRDATSGYRCYRSGALRRADPASVRSDGYCFQIEMTYRVAKSGGAVVEVPVHFTDRDEGTSKLSTGIVAEALVNVTRWGARRLVEPAPPAPPVRG